MTNSYKKEYPLAGFPGFGGGVGALSYKSGKTIPYVDDVFSTYLYTGNETSRNITNNVDISGKGGMTWVKSRNDTHDHHIVDTERGANKILYTNDDAVEASIGNRITAFNSDGFTLGTAGQVNGTSAYNYSSWSFAKQKGFLDIVKYTGNGSSQNISHSLDCIPGCMIVKNRDNNNHWAVYHRSMNPSATLAADNGKSHKLRLDELNARDTELSAWNNTAPTSSVFSVGSLDDTNGSGHELVAYLFGGGVSTDAKNVSVGAGDSANGSNSNDGYMRIPNHSDINLDGDFTIEMFIKKRGGTHDYLFTLGDSATATGFQIYYSGSSLWFYGGISSATYFSLNKTVDDYDWHHVCATRSGTTLRFYHDGVLTKTQTGCSASYSGDITTGENYSTGADGTGTPSRSATAISNFRITKGQALYTGSRFKVPDKPLTTTSQGATASNVKLLCFQSSTITEATVSPTTIVHENANGDVTATASAGPFDGGMIFGENEEDKVVKCGRYKGSGSAGLEVICGFEPQWILIKNTSRASTNWCQFDSMRGIVTGGDDSIFTPNSNASEAAPIDYIDFTATGFTIETTSHDDTNQSGDIYIYVAIRRPDGYVAKPAEAGTDVFAMDTGNSSATGPAYDANFAVDFAYNREYAGADSWATTTRLTGRKWLRLNTDDAQQSAHAYYYDDYNNGWAKSMPSNYFSWMWKRGPGLDVITYSGTGDWNDLPHSLGRKPEMVWVKRRNANSTPWMVSHKGLNAGTNYMHYYMKLNEDEAQTDGSGQGNQKFNTSSDHTATTIAIGNDSSWTNASGGEYVCMAFASVDGISKVGYYAGSASGQTITVGFQPRFIIIRNIAGSRNWVTFDTVRGWGAGNDQELTINKTDAQGGNNDRGEPTATGFTVGTGNDDTNGSGMNYIYYAHA